MAPEKSLLILVQFISQRRTCLDKSSARKTAVQPLCYIMKSVVVSRRYMRKSLGSVTYPVRAEAAAV
jgi:hypothetical protein